MKFIKPIAFLLLLFLINIFSGFTNKNITNNKVAINYLKETQETQVAYFASGCFWCVEAIFESVVGVEEVISGYAGGHTKNPTYRKIGTGRTGHSETVAIYYNPKKVSYQTLVTVFYGSHDPTTKNGQHPDYGSQYRSIAFYSNISEKNVIDTTIKKLDKELYNGKIVTEVTKFTKFYPAEKYHQDYERLHPENPYIKNVSIPRLNRFKSKFPELLKKGKY